LPAVSVCPCFLATKSYITKPIDKVQRGAE